MSINHPMLIICKYIEHTVYSDISEQVKNKIQYIQQKDNTKNTNNTDNTNTDNTNNKKNKTIDMARDIIMNAIPIKYGDKHWLLSNLCGLEISSVNLLKTVYEIRYIKGRNISNTIPINKVCSVHEIDSVENLDKIDCFYDDHLNIMFIKFFDADMKYYDMNYWTEDNFSEFEKSDIMINWINNLLECKTINSPSNKIIFENKFINLPSIPYIVSNPRMITNFTMNGPIDYPCSGAVVTDNKDNFLGIVKYAGKNNIVSIGINTIIRSLNYIDNNPMYKLYYEVQPIQILLKDALDKDIVEYGLYYDKNDSIKKDYTTQNIILSIDEYSILRDGKLNINGYSVPLDTYIWLFKKDDNIKIKGISSNCIKNNRINKELRTKTIDCRNIENFRFCYYVLKLSNKNNESLSVSKLNYIKMNKTYLIEVNEKLMQILKILIETTDDYDDLYDHIYNNRFTNKKTVVTIDNKLNIQIIKKLKNSNLNDIMPFTIKNKSTKIKLS